MSTPSSLTPDMSDFGSVERMHVWERRPWRFKIEHRCNVVAALLRGEVSLRSCWFGLRQPHAVVALGRKSPEAGMVYVCPAWADELESACAR